MAGTDVEPAGFKAGFVTIVGRPNAGKSTLLNALLGQKLSIVSPLPQTTRHKILGIRNGPGYQACFLDTPGMLDAARDGLQQALIKTVKIANREDADVVVLLVEPIPPSPEALAALGRLAGGPRPVLLTINKADLSTPEKLREVARAYEEAFHPAEIHVVSALQGHGVGALLSSIVKRLPESPAYYPADVASDRWDRFFVSEIIRERIFELYHEEVPHACAVSIEEYAEGPPDRIQAVVFVEREPQKGILIGAKGAAIRKLTEESLTAIKKYLGRAAVLDLRVKVRSNWRRDPKALQEFGYT